MKEIFLIAVPLVFAAAAFAWPNEKTRPWLLPVAASSAFSAGVVAAN